MREEAQFARSMDSVALLVRGLRRSPLAWYAGLYTASAAALRLAGFTLFLWLARGLSVEEYATFGLFYALQTGLATLATAGIVEVVVGLRKDHTSAPMRHILLGAANASFALMSVAVSTVALLAFTAFKSASVATLLLCTGASALGVLTAFSTLQAQLTRLDENHLASLCFNFFAPFAGLVGGALGFLVERSVESYFLGSALGSLLALLGLRALRVGVYDLALGWDRIGLVFGRIGPFVAMAMLGWLSGYGNNYLVQALFGHADVARFTFALNFSSMMQLVATALNQVWSPRFYRMVQELPWGYVESRNGQFFRLQGWVLGLIGGALLALLPLAVRLFGGNLSAYRSMSFELLLLCASYVLLSPWWHCYNYYLVHGKRQELMRIFLITSVLGIAAWLAMMALLGPPGIYIGFLTQMLIRTLAIVIAARRHWPVRIAWDGVAIGTLFVLGGYFISTI